MTSPRSHGELHLGFSYDGASQKTRLTEREQRPPLQVIRAFDLPDGASMVHLHNISGGVLGGDLLEMSVNIGPQAKVQLTTTSATRIYRSRDVARPAIQTTKVTIGDGGVLEYVPDQIIPFAGSEYRQDTQITLGDDAGLFWWETVAPGRVAHGELFAYDTLEMTFDLRAGNKPLLIERSRIQPQRTHISSSARLGSYRYFATFVICRVGVPSAQWLTLERDLSEVAQQLSNGTSSLWGVSTLTAHGLCVRALSMTGRDIAPGLHQFWQLAKRALYGCDPIVPRKVY